MDDGDAGEKAANSVDPRDVEVEEQKVQEETQAVQRAVTQQDAAGEKAARKALNDAEQARDTVTKTYMVKYVVEYNKLTGETVKTTTITNTLERAVKAVDDGVEKAQQVGRDDVTAKQPLAKADATFGSRAAFAADVEFKKDIPTRNALQAGMDAMKKWFNSIFERSGAKTRSLLKELKKMQAGWGEYKDNLDNEGNIRPDSRYAKDQTRLNEIKSELEERMSKDTKFNDAIEREAAKTGTETKTSYWKRFWQIFGALAACGGLGFLGWYMYQYAVDHTGCFSYVGTLGPNRMGCSDLPNATFDQVKNCNCGGGFKPGQVNLNAIQPQKPPSTPVGYPPNTCGLGVSQQQKLGDKGGYATCTISVTGDNAVLYAYKKTSALQALAALPSWLGGLGKGLLGDLMGGLGGIFKIILYIGLAIVGCIILLMVIRFAWNKFRGSKGGGSSKGGGGGKTIVIEEGGGGSSRRKS